MAIADALADRENRLIKLRREHGIQVSKNAKEIQDLLLAYRDESNSAEDRREMIRKANALKLKGRTFEIFPVLHVDFLKNWVNSFFILLITYCS